MLLRCLQAAGSASTTTTGAGVIGDIAIPAERGGFFGIYSLGPLVILVALVQRGRHSANVERIGWSLYRSRYWRSSSRRAWMAVCIAEWVHVHDAPS